MSNKDSRSGGKYTGNHSTLCPLATQICDIVNDCKAVTKISPGFVKTGLRPVNGNRRVKVRVQQGGMLLSIRDNISHQEVRIYTSDSVATKNHIEDRCRKVGIDTNFS